MHEFHQFMTVLRADERLGRFVQTLQRQEPEVVVLKLVEALALACEGRQPHPAMELLDRMQSKAQNAPVPISESPTPRPQQFFDLALLPGNSLH